jgi:hypothetical protein
MNSRPGSMPSFVQDALIPFRIAPAPGKRYDAAAMTQINWEEERRRLAIRYEAMEDGELEKIAKDLHSLTSVGRETLQAEMAKRGIAVTASPAKADERPIVDDGKNPVIIRKYRDLPEATVEQSILESAGIECFLADTNLVRMDWFYSNLVGGIKLMVRVEDAEAAIKLLDEGRPEKFDVEGIGEYQQPHCPKCGSMDISFDGLNNRLTFGAMWITGVPIPVVNYGWGCHNCKHQWNDKESEATDIPPSEDSEL